MKKAFPANINGRIYYIDEDAYGLLNRYLTELHNTFTGAEGTEIVEDMEGRIAEHFDERRRGGQEQVITIEDVTAVIGVMGRPEDLSDEPSSDEPGTAANGTGRDVPPPFNGVHTEAPRKRLFRNPDDRILGGVLGGLAVYWGWDPAVMRILLTLFAICTAVWPCLLVYLVCWMVIPLAKTPKEILEMRGEPVNFTTVGQTVVDATTNTVRNVSNGIGGFFNGVFRVVGAFFAGLFGLCAGIGAVVFIILAIIVMVAIITIAVGGSVSLAQAMDIPMCTPYVSGFGIFLAMLAAAVPLLAVMWGAAVMLFHAPSASRGLIITAIVFEILFIAGAVILLNLGNMWPHELACLTAPGIVGMTWS